MMKTKLLEECNLQKILVSKYVPNQGFKIFSILLDSE